MPCHDPKARYRTLQNLLRKARQDAGLTQAELAARLGKPQSYVSKYEHGERRLDIVELLEVMSEIGADPLELVRAIQATR